MKGDAKKVAQGGKKSDAVSAITLNVGGLQSLKRDVEVRERVIVVVKRLACFCSRWLEYNLTPSG